MIITLLNAFFTFASHTTAAVSLAPFKYSKRTTWALFYFGSPFIAPPPQSTGIVFSVLAY